MYTVLIAAIIFLSALSIYLYIMCWERDSIIENLNDVLVSTSLKVEVIFQELQDYKNKYGEINE